ncbi:MAG: hypothetical protein RLZZ623_1115 [Actinomycetota bacterium]
MRQLFLGGRVFTADPGRPWAQAVVVDGERIAFVGNEIEAIRFAGPTAGRFHLGGGVLLPGFVDGHAHLIMTGDALLKAQLRSAKDLADIQGRVAAWAAEHPDAPRVLGLGWVFSAVPDGRPTKEMLDAVVSDRPVFLDASDLHSSWLNSRALAELGITDDTPDPIGGRIVRDPVTGEATGHLLENATVTMVWPLLDRVDQATRDQRLAAAAVAYNECGVTAAVDMALDKAMFTTMRRADEAGTLSIRVAGHWLIHRTGDAKAELAQVAAAAAAMASYRSDRLRIAGIKIIADGTIDGCTAALLNPYTNGVNAAPIWDLESLTAVVTAADASGLQVAIHAIGDLTVRNAIDALEHAIAVNGSSDHRHRIEHLEYVDAADISRLHALGITASMQPVHVDPVQLPNWIAMLGPERADRGFAWREFLDAGTTLAFGTDTPTAPHLPLHNMFIAATRKSPSDLSLSPHRPDNALPLTEAIEHGTRDSAWASFDEHRIGMIRTGLFADLAAVDIDVFAAEPEALLSARVMLTMLAGHTVYRSSDD